MASKLQKTNAMRILERMKIPYEHREYDADGFTDGLDTAIQLGLPPEQVYKTLVTVGADRQYYVFVIPVGRELDLKKCARSVNVKSVSMIAVKELFPLTGYVRGGCTAIGMKKQFVTRLDRSAERIEKIYVSGGRIGCQILLTPGDFLKAARAEYGDLV